MDGLIKPAHFITDCVNTNNNIQTYDYELFKYLNINNTIYYEYLISTYGRVYSFKTNKFLTPADSHNGYLLIGISINGILKTERLHRSVLMTFYPIDNPEKYQVNHYDGNKKNNHVCNLYWCTAKENVEHAVRMGLKPLGEDHNDALLTNAQVRFICECLESNIDYREIYKAMNINIEFEKIRKIIYRIRYGDCWSHISKDYDFSRDKQNKTSYSEDEIHCICKSLEAGKSYNEICDMFGITDRSSRSLCKRVIRSIASGTNHTDISSQYSIVKPKGLRDPLFTEDDIHLICKYIKEGRSPMDILILLGLDSVDQHKRTNLLRSINSIKNKKSFTDISNKYF